MKKLYAGLNAFIYHFCIWIYFVVLFCVICFGMDMKYNASRKLTTDIPNRNLFFMVLPVLLFCIFLIKCFTKKEISFQKNILMDILLFILFTVLFFVNVRVADAIAFTFDWDVEEVNWLARDFVAQAVPLEYYYSLSMARNNIPITYLLGQFYKFFMRYGWYAEPVQGLLRINCLLVSAAGFFCCLTVKKLTQNMMAVWSAFWIYLILVGISPWKVAPYTDIYGLVFPICAVYFYICGRHSGHPAMRWIQKGLAVLLSFLGGMIKPSIYLTLVAIIIVECMALLTEGKAYFRDIAIELVMIVILSVFVGKCQDFMIERIGLDYNPEIAVDLSNYFYMGLNEETTGGYNAADRNMIGEFQFSKKDRNRAELQRSMMRFKERGVFGTIYFWIRKMVRTFNDGMFEWRIMSHPSGYFYFATDNSFVRQMRALYWQQPDGDSILQVKYNTFIHWQWLMCQIGILFIVFDRKREENNILVLCFLGCFLYQLLFEAGPRYLLVFLPVFIVLSVCGMTAGAEKLDGICANKKADNRNHSRDK